MNEITERYEALLMENNRLRAENESMTLQLQQLEKHAAVHCVGCVYLKRHDCGAFYVCMHKHSPGMVVNPHVDFCSRRKTKGYKQRKESAQCYTP